MAKKPDSGEDKIHPLGKAMLWIEEDDNIGRMIAIVAVMCVFLFIAEFAIERKSHFEWEAYPGFFGILGFLAFGFIIYSTKLLKWLISRPENYYGKSSTASEQYPVDQLDIREHDDD